jgi:hypothetical protein
MKLQISIDGQGYEVEVEVAEEDYPPQMQDSRPNRGLPWIHIITKPNCAAVLWPESSCVCR